ncbi:MAG: outer membrane protein assembly factor BamC [Nitrospirae bacterium]|nr:outer membrane protein assembly factor BamC [Nitrospirota bacterium]
MPRRLFTIALLCWFISQAAGCLTTVHINPAQPPAQVRLVPADREQVWAVLLGLLEERNIQIVDSNKAQGWVRTDFIYFRPMDFGEPVLTGRMMMGQYLDVQGGRYRLLIQLAPAGPATSVRVVADVQRLEQRVAEAPQAEPSFSLDAPAQQKHYLVQVPQPSNGVIERHFLVEVEAAVGVGNAPPVSPRSHAGGRSNGWRSVGVWDGEVGGQVGPEGGVVLRFDRG